MRPDYATNDIGNGCLVDAVFRRQNGLANVSGSIPPADFADLSRGQLGKPVLLSARVPLSSLLPHIADVVGLCSKKQVDWVRTRAIIATVKRAKFGGEWAFGNSVGNAMGREGLPRLAVPNVELAITERTSARTPRPALISPTDADLLPKPKNVLRRKRWDATIHSSHDRLLVRLSWLERLAASSAGRSFSGTTLQRKAA